MQNLENWINIHFFSFKIYFISYIVRYLYQSSLMKKYYWDHKKQLEIILKLFKSNIDYRILLRSNSFPLIQ